ncbi:hypothetical protein ABT214_15350 [Micromonospora purpureochromogenes]|uniref:hypothetical protein n=1 Tax=Micromonospora purpureochromogenes TaxID=47872 RepID=UPI0033176816
MPLTMIVTRPRPGRAAPLLAQVVAGLVATLLLAGCGLVVRPRPAAALRFEFAPTTGDGYMNQVLTIFNEGTQVLAPTLEFTALDAAGRALPSVRVATVFGSDRGRLVVPPGAGVDVLTFTGAGARAAEDVTVSVRTAEPVDAPAVDVVPVVTPVDDGGRVLDRNSRFTAVSVRNDDSEQMSVRLLYIIWTDPPADQRQQAERVVPVGDLIVLPPKHTTLVPVTGEARAAVADAAGRAPTSIKAYLSR